jgi:hypothetical protein
MKDHCTIPEAEALEVTVERFIRNAKVVLKDRFTPEIEAEWRSELIKPPIKDWKLHHGERA